MSDSKRRVIGRVYDLNRQKIEGAKLREGWHDGFCYRAFLEPEYIGDGFKADQQKCPTCGESHRIPYEGNPHYIRETVPRRVARNWAMHHNIVVYIERRPARYHHKLGKRTVPLGTDLDEVVPYGEWERYLIVKPNGNCEKILK